MADKEYWIDLALKRGDECDHLRDEYRRLVVKLENANSLLRRVYSEQEPTIALLCDIGDHLGSVDG